MADGEKEKPTQKRSFFHKAKKLALTGVLATGIILGGIGVGRAAQFEYMRDPPTPQQTYYQVNYKEGWKALIKGHELLSRKEYSKGYLDKAIRYFENEKKKDTKRGDWDKLCLHYVLDYCYYLKACDGKISKEAEDYLKRAIELATKDYETFKDRSAGEEVVFLDLIVLSYRNIGYTYFNCGGGNEKIKGSINPVYLKIAKENFQKAFELYKEHKKELIGADEEYPTMFEKVGQYLQRIDQILGEKEEQAKVLK